MIYYFIEFRSKTDVALVVGTSEELSREKGEMVLSQMDVNYFNAYIIDTDLGCLTNLEKDAVEHLYLKRSEEQAIELGVQENIITLREELEKLSPEEFKKRGPAILAKHGFKAIPVSDLIIGVNGNSIDIHTPGKYPIDKKDIN
jgi:hypothetical protein